MRSRFARSLLALAVLGAARPLAANADTMADLTERVEAAVHSGEGLLRRVFHLQSDPIVSHAISVSTREAALDLETRDGHTRHIAFRGGHVWLDDADVGTYAPGGALERSWRRLLADGTQLDTRAVVVALRAWRVEGLGTDEAAAKEHLDEMVRAFTSGSPVVAAVREVPAPPTAESADKSVAQPTPAPDVPAAPEAAPEGGVAAPAATSAIDRLFHDVTNVVAVFIALAMLGFGTVFFGRRYIEVVADTAQHSFGRSLVVGLLGQLLLLPTFAMLIVGLVCTIVGILLLPFAIVAYVAAACVALLGGYLAVAHAVGETFTRRRMAHGAFVSAPNAYGYLFTGLVGLLGLWAAAALVGWMGPVVILFRIAAGMVTWLAATVGFGAVLLARGGLRETFAGRHVGEMSDEYLWATPPATPTAGRARTDHA